MTVLEDMTMKKRILTATLAGAVGLIAGQAAHADPLGLAQSSGCMACHAVDTKVVGPAWKDVAARYKGQDGAREALIQKVKAGGAGNWTDVTGGMPMPPNSPRVSDADIATLVDFVLSLD